MKASTRSLVQRSGLLLALVLLSCYLFYIGKGHTLIIDTNALTIDGKEYSSPESIEVSIDGKAAEEMGRAERIMVLVGGPQHTITIAIGEGNEGGEADRRQVEKRFVLPTFMEAALVSVPAILGESPPQHWVSTFVAAENEESAAEQMQHEEADEPASASAAAVPGGAAAPPLVKP